MGVFPDGFNNGIVDHAPFFVEDKITENYRAMSGKGMGGTQAENAVFGLS